MAVERDRGSRSLGGHDDVEMALKRRLAEDRYVDDSTLAVRVEGDKATIAGQVPDRDTFERVHAIVARAPGVREIDNVLTIAPRAQRKDRDVVRALRRKLEDDFPTSRVEVSLVGSTAVLEGLTDHPAEREEIERTVQGYAHVDHIVNHIRLS